MDSLNIMIDSQHLSTVAAALLRLAADYPLHITISGTLDECIAREQEIMHLLAQTPHKPTFTFGIGFDMTKFASDADRFAVKLHDFGRRGVE